MDSRQSTLQEWGLHGVREATGYVGEMGGIGDRLASLMAAALLVAGTLTFTACGAQSAGGLARSDFGLRVPSSPGATALPASASPTPKPDSGGRYLVPIVPIVSFWSTQRSISRVDLARLLSGNPTLVEHAYSRVVITSSDEAAITATFHVALGPAVKILAPADVIAAVRASPATLGLIRADDVTPDVRAVAVDGKALFGAERIKDLTAWPLDIQSETPATFDTTRAWTLTAGGDVNLDRSVYVAAVTNGKGPDYPWAGGTARIAGFTCCGYQGSSLVIPRRTGNAGAFRALLADADLSIVNLEGPASADFVPRQDGFKFTVDPDLLAGLRNAGIDAVSLANNHIRNAGDKGVIETGKVLDALGIAHAGAGIDAATASAPARLGAAGLRVAFLAYDAQEPANWVRAGRPGAAPLIVRNVVADIKAARAAGFDFVVVMPHWGVEYTESVSLEQRREAAAMVAAGADLILGAHSHYAGGLQTIAKPSGNPAFVVYSLGNLLFDFDHDESTQEGVVDDLTFVGNRLVQVDLHPTIMVDHSQVNLMDPAGDGQRVLDRIRKASGRYLPW